MESKWDTSRARYHRLYYFWNAAIWIHTGWRRGMCNLSAIWTSCCPSNFHCISLTHVISDSCHPTGLCDNWQVYLGSRIGHSLAGHFQKSYSIQTWSRLGRRAINPSGGGTWHTYMWMCVYVKTKLSSCKVCSSRDTGRLRTRRRQHWICEDNIYFLRFSAPHQSEFFLGAAFSISSSTSATKFWLLKQRVNRIWKPVPDSPKSFIIIFFSQLSSFSLFQISDRDSHHHSILVLSLCLYSRWIIWKSKKKKTSFNSRCCPTNCTWLTHSLLTDYCSSFYNVHSKTVIINHSAFRTPKLSFHMWINRLLMTVSPVISPNSHSLMRKVCPAVAWLTDSRCRYWSPTLFRLIQLKGDGFHFPLTDHPHPAGQKSQLLLNPSSALYIYMIRLEKRRKA